MIDDPWTQAYLERKAKAVFGTLGEENVAKDWKPWFAWYPVAFGPHIAWLKTIERAKHNGEWFYRLSFKDRNKNRSDVDIALDQIEDIINQHGTRN